MAIISKMNLLNIYWMQGTLVDIVIIRVAWGKENIHINIVLAIKGSIVLKVK